MSDFYSILIYSLRLYTRIFKTVYCVKVKLSKLNNKNDNTYANNAH